MSCRQPPSRPLTGGLRRVSLLVPEGSADGLRQLAREYRARYRLGMSAGGWRRLSPSAELLIEPETGARCAIRDSRRSGAERYLWTLTVLGYHQLAAGRTGEVAEARSRAEAALAVTRRLGARCHGMDVVIMSERPLSPVPALRRYVQSYIMGQRTFRRRISKSMA